MSSVISQHVSSKYRLVETQALIDNISACLDGSGIAYLLRRIPGKSGKKGWLEFVLVDHGIQLFGTDLVIPKILVRNSQDGSSALQIHIGFLRLVCSNGLILGPSLYSDRVVHTHGPKIETFLDQLPARIMRAVNYIESGVLQWELEVATSTQLSWLSQLQIVTCMKNEGIISERVANDVRMQLLPGGRRPEDTNTIWGVYNIINEVIRRRGRSAFAQMERNVSLLESVITASQKAVA